MSLTPIHTFVDGENLSTLGTLLNAEFDNIYHYFGNLTNGDLDVSSTRPYPYVIASTGTPINDQVAAAIAAGKYLYLPAGSYTIEPFNMPAGTRIVGAGAEHVSILIDNSVASSSIITIGASSDPYDILIKGVTISAPTGSVAAIRFFNILMGVPARNIRFEDCIFNTVPATGRVYVYTSGIGTASDIVFERCEFQQNAQVAVITNSSYVTFDRCRFINNTLGIVHSTTSYSSTEGMITVTRCYYEIVSDLTGEAYLDRIRARAVYENNMFRITDGTGLTAVILFSHEGDGAKIFEGNSAVRGEDAADMYWVHGNANHVVFDFNRFDGADWNTNNLPFLVDDTSASTSDPNTMYSRNLNFNIFTKDQVIDAVTALNRRVPFPHVDKHYHPYAGYDRATMLTMGDLMFSIDEYLTGTNTNKLTVYRFDDASQQIIDSAQVEMDGTTPIYD